MYCQDRDIISDLLGSSSFAEVYDKYRPHLPKALIKTLLDIVGMDTIGLVVDLGCGTGLSTLAWSNFAEYVIGIDSNNDFLSLANDKLSSGKYPNVQFEKSSANSTGLKDSSVTIVTCAQSLHWMEPAPTFREINRILAPGGVFIAYDYTLPPLINWEVSRDFNVFIKAVNNFEKKTGTGGFGKYYWKKDRFAQYFRESGYFQYSNNFCFTSKAKYDLQRLIGLAFSYTDIWSLIDVGFTLEELGILNLIQSANEKFDESVKEYFLDYQVNFGIK